MTESIFCNSLPAQPRIWDPSMLRIKMTCDRKHWLMTVRGLRRNGGSSVHQEWGKAYHSCVEMFDTMLLLGGEREATGDAVLHYAFDISWDPVAAQPMWGEWLTVIRCTDPEMRPPKRLRREEFDDAEDAELLDRQPTKLVKNRERCVLAKYPQLVNGPTPSRCHCGLPLTTERLWLNHHRKKNRLSLLRAVALYCDTEEGVRPYLFGEGMPAVEVQERIGLEIESPDPMTVVWHNPDGSVVEVQRYKPYELIVNIDSVVERGDRLAIRERKTTGQRIDARYWRQFEFDPQIDSYDLVGHDTYARNGLPPEIMVEATRVGEKDAEIQRQTIYITDERREEWLEELQGVILDAEWKSRSLKTIGSLEKAFPRNSTACHGAYGICPMFAICSAPKSEREAIIAADYHVERWNPLTAARESDDEAGSD